MSGSKQIPHLVQQSNMIVPNAPSGNNTQVRHLTQPVNNFQQTPQTPQLQQMQQMQPAPNAPNGPLNNLPPNTLQTGMGNNADSSVPNVDTICLLGKNLPKKYVYIVGVVVLLAILYYLWRWNNSKKDESQRKLSHDEMRQEMIVNSGEQLLQNTELNNYANMEQPLEQLNSNEKQLEQEKIHQYQQFIMMKAAKDQQQQQQQQQLQLQQQQLQLQQQQQQQQQLQQQQQQQQQQPPQSSQQLSQAETTAAQLQLQQDQAAQLQHQQQQQQVAQLQQMHQLQQNNDGPSDPVDQQFEAQMRKVTQQKTSA